MAAGRTYGYLGLVSQDDLAEAKLVAGYVQRREEADIRGV